MTGLSPEETFEFGPHRGGQDAQQTFTVFFSTMRRGFVCGSTFGIDDVGSRAVPGQSDGALSNPDHGVA